MRGALRKSCLATAACLWLLPAAAHAWGASAQRLIAAKAIETLPPEVRAFFQANRHIINQHVTEPLDWLTKSAALEKRNQYIYLDRYGRFPFENLARSYNFAVRKHTKRVLDANGLLPWQIGVYSEKLTNALKAHNWDEAKQLAAVLAFYVAEAHDPFKTTEDFDGKLAGQAGVDRRFSAILFDRYSTFLFLRPNDAEAVSDPTDRAFEICLSSHSWIQNILLADRRARRGMPDYTDEYYDRFYNQAGAILVRQMSDAASDVGSFWLTAWINAGRPPLPPR
jgi:hypothetical protein